MGWIRNYQLAQQVKPPPARARNLWALVLDSTTPLPFQLPVCDLGKQWRMTEDVGTLCPPPNPKGDPEEAPGCGWVPLQSLWPLGE